MHPSLALPLAVFLCAASWTQAQTPPSKGPLFSDPNGYRLTRTNGSIYLLKQYQQVGPFYHVVDVNDQRMQHLVSSVATIEPLAEGLEAARPSGYFSPGYLSPGTRPKPRAKYRKSDVSAIDPMPVPPMDVSGGFFSPGFPLHVGPRGGVFYYNQSGNKTYVGH